MTEKFTIHVEGIRAGERIPEEFAYCVWDGVAQTCNAPNINPAISWKDAPVATKSFALIMVDPDVPTDFTNANKAGKTIPADFPRRNFYHWVVLNIPANITHIAKGEENVAGIEGQNDYGSDNFGYDGPCPPWNDERLHHYHFVIYALDCTSVAIKEPFTGSEAEAAIVPHILAKAESVAWYTTNPHVTLK